VQTCGLPIYAPSGCQPHARVSSRRWWVGFAGTGRGRDGTAIWPDPTRVETAVPQRGWPEIEGSADVVDLSGVGDRQTTPAGAARPGAPQLSQQCAVVVVHL